MEKLYKPSMFNHYVEELEPKGLILFNSFSGMNYIIRVSEEKKQKIIDWFSHSVIEHKSIVDDNDFVKLLNMGYFVDSSINEKRKREVLLNKLKADSVLRLVIHISKSCNFRCKYCYMSFDEKTNHDSNISKDVQNGIINFVRKNIKKYTALHVDWFGGEPLMDIAAIQYISEHLIKICEKVKKPYEAVITTNGYLLTERNIDILLKNKVRHIAVTIDGLRERHNFLRTLKNGTATFDRIIDNLKYIRDYIKTQTLSISIRSNMTIEALETIEKYYHFYNDLFGNDRRFSLFLRPVKNMGGESVNQLDDILFQNSNIDFGFVFQRLEKVIDKIQFDSNFIDIRIGGMKCYSNNLNSFTIGVDGLVTKCDESIEEIGIGYLTADGEMILDENKHADWLCSIQISEKCENCFYSCCCLMDPCPKARIIENGKESCPAAVHEIDSLLRLYVKSYDVQSL